MSIALSQYKDRDRVLLIEAGRLHPAFSFTRSTIGTMLGSAGLIVTSGIDVPRFEYDSSGNYLGLLLEGASTNLMRSSNQIQSSPWRGIGTTVTGNTTVASDGTTTGTSLKFNTAAGSAYWYQEAPSVSITPTSVWTISAFTKSSTRVLAWGGATPAGTDTYSIVTYPSGWYRQIVTRAFTVTNASALLQSLFLNNLVGITTVIVWADQLEVGASATSYIPTTSSAVTRSADVLSATLASLGISATSGTFVIEHDVPSGNPLIYSGSNQILSSSGGTKVAIAYDASGWAKSVNGGAVTTSGTPLTFGSTLDIGKSPTGGANGHIKPLTWYRARRPDVELMRLSV